MIKAVWGTDYDGRTDQIYRRPCCGECKEPLGLTALKMGMLSVPYADTQLLADVTMTQKNYTIAFGAAHGWR